MELPEEIWDELNSSSRNELQSNSKRFIRDTQRYVAGDWTKTPVINKLFMADLKRYQVEAKQVISNRYDDSDKLRIVGRSAAEIFEGLGAYMESGDQETFLQVMEKNLPLQALRLPQHAKHLEDQHVEDDTKSVVMPIHPASQQYLTFKHQGVVYQYKSMAFGLSVVPRVFTKIMRYALEPLRRKGIRFAYYLQDICILEKNQRENDSSNAIDYKTFDQARFSHQLGEKCSHPQSYPKILWLCLQHQEDVNFCSCAEITEIDDETEANIEPSSSTTIMQMDSIATPEIHAKRSSKIITLHHQTWEAPCHLSHESQEELRWWKDFASTRNGLDIQKPAERNLRKASSE
ncbi:hypothetical protein G6F16_007570 [Rhizopus arrhizus]|nr:hypothetical protein G6F21_009345 [Rhizopus arrhizus]KAG0813410.1 hypothetical protein G6F20_005587 [Rhizopus arrhizus]KAG0824675.1 hypothetical protein G6F18_010762 [Rhizopus arrhizus]KAG0827393.1 hypothetical protein G6F19_008794 [Rhizopus arrhizus]KAG0849539.1 hypothetical protein G6F17_010678 [Rhizopus arrhizus]